MQLDRNQQTLFVVLIIVALVSILFYLLEFEEVEVNLGYSKEAKKNRFLAAQLLLDRHGFDSERTIQYTLLDSLSSGVGFGEASFQVRESDTIILVNARGTVNGHRFDSLWRWVNNGGNLITSLENPFVGTLADDDLLHALGIYVISEYEDENVSERYGDKFIDDAAETEDNIERGVIDEEAGSEQMAKNGGGAEPEEKTFIYSDSKICRNNPDVLSLSSESLNIDFRSGNSFYFEEYSPSWVMLENSEYDSDYVAGSFSVGDGQVTMLRNTAIWRNPLIQCHDHAYFLLSLIERNSKVWILENRDAPSLFSLMYNYIPAALFAFLMTVVFVVWSALTRFGPLFQPQPIERRRFAEHIIASATFLWKRGEYTKLLYDLRVTIDSMMSRRVTSYEKKTVSEKVTLVEKFSHLNNRRLREALFKQEIETLDEFVEFVKILKMLKDNL